MGHVGSLCECLGAMQGWQWSAVVYTTFLTCLCHASWVLLGSRETCRNLSRTSLVEGLDAAAFVDLAFHLLRCAGDEME
jgi:hypothetical protein